MSQSASILEKSTADCDADSGAPSVPSVCAECGWPFVDRAGECLVKLEVNRAGAPFSASVGRAADGEVTAWVHLAAAAAELGDGSEPDEASGLTHESAACRQAVEAVFAEISKRIRLVRGVFRNAPAATVPALEVRIPANGGGEELGDALSALSVACELAGPELRLLLSDPIIAESYLAQLRQPRESSSRRQDSPDTCVPGDASSSEALF